MNPDGNNLQVSGNRNGGTMLRVLGAAQKREVKATQNLSIIVLFFIICWMPLYTINCVNAFFPDSIGVVATDCCIILSHLNSAINPLLYAYHLRDFRAALKSLIFKMFGIKETNPTNDTYYKPSIISQHQRRQSNMDKRPSILFNNQPKVYVDSPIWLRQKNTEFSNVSPVIPSTSAATSPASVESNSILNHNNTLANTPECGQRREIWMISEVPSISDEKDVSEECVEITPKRMLDPLSDEYDDDDDEVFLPLSDKNLTVVQYDFNNDNTYSTELPFRECRRNSNTFSENSEDFSTVRCNSFKRNSESHTAQKNSVHEHDRSSVCSNSPSHRIFVVQNDDETFNQSPNLSCISKNTKESKLEHTNSSSISSEYSCSPTKTLRLSPLKIVGDFLFNQSSKKCQSKKKSKYVLPKQSSGDVCQYLDLQKNGVIYKCNTNNR